MYYWTQTTNFPALQVTESIKQSIDVVFKLVLNKQVNQSVDRLNLLLKQLDPIRSLKQKIGENSCQKMC